MTSIRSMTKLIIKYGLECYSLVQKRKVSLSKFSDAFQNLDKELIKSWIIDYNQDNYSSYYKYYTKLDCIDEVLSLNLDRYEHLRSIRDVVRMETIVDKILDDKTYKKALSLYYARLLFSKIFKSRPGLEIKYLPLIERENEEFFQLVMRNIDNYYINIITK